LDYSDYKINLFENSLSPEVCQDIIQRFDVDTRKFEGGVSYGDGEMMLNPELKKCTELFLSAHSDWKDIDEILFAQINEKILLLREMYPGLKRVVKVLDEGYRIKHYKNDGNEFFNWHIDSNGRKQSHRYYVFMWYLNDVEEGGETEFRIQDCNGDNIKVQPKQGSMLCFPPFWTHEHRGRAPLSSDKYIIASWITF
jgi:hypothetical protein